MKKIEISSTFIADHELLGTGSAVAHQLRVPSKQVLSIDDATEVQDQIKILAEKVNQLIDAMLEIKSRL